MPSYLVQLSYSPAALAGLIEHPQDRNDAVRKPIEKLGGRFDRFYLSFGEYDVVGISKCPTMSARRHSPLPWAPAAPAGMCAPRP